MTRVNILLVIGLFLGLVLVASSIEIYDPIVQYILFIVVFSTMIVLINFMLNPE